jgi:hypothetical protein
MPTKTTSRPATTAPGRDTTAEIAYRQKFARR